MATYSLPTCEYCHKQIDGVIVVHGGTDPTDTHMHTHCAKAAILEAGRHGCKDCYVTLDINGHPSHSQCVEA